MSIIRYNSNTFEHGEEYFGRLSTESERNFRILLSLLSSYWQSTIDGPNYTREIKAMAVELSRIRLLLESIQSDVQFSSTRTEFLYQMLTSMMFPRETGAPDTGQSDKDFQNFLVNLVSLYFSGSVPSTIKEAIQLITNSNVIVKENFLEAKNHGTGFDISDQFGYSIDIILNSPSQINTFLSNKNIKLLLAIIRPSHTLYRIRNILQDSYTGSVSKSNNTESSIQTNKIIDSYTWNMSNYNYEDFRRFVGGVYGIDPLGDKRSIKITNEDHSDDF